MKTTELMIGDWVLSGTELAQITSMTCDGIVETTRRGYFSEEVIEPIPLTPKILEKNGFKLNPQGAYSNGRHTSISVIRDGRYFANINTETDDPSFLYQCGRYVHEFQHALRLCGLNDLADNLKLEE